MEGLYIAAQSVNDADEDDEGQEDTDTIIAILSALFG